MSTKKKIWSITWRVVAGTLLLTWIFHVIFLNEGQLLWQKKGLDWKGLSRSEQWQIAWTHGPTELWHTLSHVHPIAFVGSVVLVFLTIILGVIRWQMVLKVQGLDLPFRRATGISFVSQFFNSFLLGSTGGDLIKAYYAARETHHKKTEAVVTVFVDRLIGLWSMLLFAGLMMLPNLSLIYMHKRLAACAAVVLLLFVGCSGLLAIAFWGGVSQRWPSARLWMRKFPKGELLERSIDSCRRFGQEKTFLIKSVVISMIINALCVLQVTILACGMGIKISTLALFVIVPIVTCISALPITPSGLGVRENLFVWMLAVPEINVAATPALSLSLLAYAGSLFWSLIGGLVYLGLKKKEHLEEITATPEKAKD